MKKLFLIRRPSMEGTSIPTFNYTFAENAEDAIIKVRLKYGEYDIDIISKELTSDELDELVIGTDYYG